MPDTKNLKEVFVYLDSINEFIKFNILKIINVNIIYDNYDFSKKVFLDIKNFCKKYNLNLFIKDNYQAAIKFKLAGLVISHTNKKILGYGNPLCNKQKIKIIGKIHNQKEFFLKKQQIISNNTTNIYLQKEEDEMDKISNRLNNLKNIAIDMNAELKRQNTIFDEILFNNENSFNAVSENNDKIKKLL